MRFQVSSITNETVKSPFLLCDTAYRVNFEKNSISEWNDAPLRAIFNDVGVGYELLMSSLTYPAGNRRTFANDEKPERHDLQIHWKISILLEWEYSLDRD